MDKKKIFFAIHYLEIGGAETSLIGLLNALDYTKYDVDLFLYCHRGELMRFIPKEVRLLPEIAEYAQIERPMKQALRDGYWRIVFARLKAKWKYGRYVRRTHPTEGSALFQYVDNEAVKVLPPLEHLGTYDLAVSFLTPHAIVLNKVEAKRKAAWIHTDYSTIDVDVEQELPVWAGYDHIVSISKDVTQAFVGRFPELSHKVVEIHNILSPGLVRERAELMTAEEVQLEMPHREGVLNLLSVGRFCQAKNYDNVPEICRLVNERVSVCWYLIGYGSDEALIRRRIEEAGMANKVVILGKRSNPYPYMKACDVYVQPSRFEGHSVTVREAQILGKPVVVTDYPTAKSQINDGVDGVIVPMDNEGCAEGLVNFMQSKKCKTMIDRLPACHFGNEKESIKLEYLLD
jgi:glycosyltransferase involved in cell wall biosynthesis